MVKARVTTVYNIAFFYFLVSALQTELPYRDFVLLQKDRNNVKFTYIAKQLRKLNMSFFVHKATIERQSFLFEVILDYNFADSLGSSIDLGVFPYFRRVHNEELTQHQQGVLRGLSRDCGREPAKLISAHRRHHHIVDFFDNIAYLLQFHSCAIVDVLSIVCFRTAPFLQHYVQTLQDERSRCASGILSRVIKNLSNRYKDGSSNA